MAQRNPPDGGSEQLDYFLSREYEDYLDWLENHRMPTEGVELTPLQRVSWGGRCRAYFGAIFAGVSAAVVRFF
jgi:hypothetical protein